MRNSFGLRLVLSLAAHLFRGAHAEQAECIGQHLAGGGQQGDAGAAQFGSLAQHAFGGVVGMVGAGQVAGVEGHVMRRQAGGRAGQHVGVGGELEHQRLLGRRGQQAQVGGSDAADVAAHVGRPFADHGADAGMGVLHIEHRVLVVLLQRQVDVEGELGVGLAADQEEAHRVAAGPVHQVAQRHIGAGALGDLDLLAVLHDRDHLVQHIVREALRDAEVDRLQAGAHPGDGAVVVGALDVDALRVAALELVDVIGHVGHEVGVATFLLAHHAVLVVAVVGGAQPQGAALLVGLATGHQALDRLLQLPAGVDAALQEVAVELQAKGLQVQVLLVAQIGHRELADAVEVVHVARGGELAVVGLHRLLGDEGVGDVLDVVAVVGRLGPCGVAGLEALEPHLRGIGEGGDLHAGVVVIELARDLVALGLEQRAQRIAERRLARMAHMQRAGGVGRHELHHHMLAGRRALAEMGAGGQHLGHHRLLGGRLEADVDEARAGDLERLHPLLDRRLGLQRGDQPRGQFTRVGLERLGQLHRGRAGEIAMGGLLGGFKGCRGVRARGDGLQRVGECGEQRLLGLDHGSILGGGPRGSRNAWSAASQSLQRRQPPGSGRPYHARRDRSCRRSAAPYRTLPGAQAPR
mmetsp:Transcript_20389/g.78156  ORF Transcript_20389/g.78156 Transcript_20389/m.78156 type:complete len:636 (-) Transcript_20389:435-2342(-)